MVSVFGFVIILVALSTIGKVMSEFAANQRLPPGSPSSSNDVELLRDAVADMGTRLHKLEEERDFYRQLLEAPDDPPTRGLRPGRQSPSEDPQDVPGGEDLGGPNQRLESD